MRVNSFIWKTVLLLVLLSVLLGSFVAYATEGVTGQVAAEGVNLRREPNTESPIIEALALGTVLEVLAHEDGWYRVLYGNEVGYIRQDYLFINSNGSRGAYVLDDSAVLRGGPSQSSYAIMPLSAGQGVKIKAMVDEWYFAAVNDQTGYIHRTYVTISSSNTMAVSMLKIGMEGAEVKKLQTELSRRGFLSKEDVTGAYGAKTRAAVLDYQKTCNLSPADGIAGPQTLTSIYDKNNTVKKETATFSQLKGSVVLLDWFKGGSTWLAKGARFTITDVKTGLSFRARRFGGWFHADSEPITAADTAIMKRIAGGSWTWNRRAIWVTYNGKTVAASMHCMPHMSNPTPSNNFDGHFCVHLLNSKVHETSRACPRHQACVQQAYNAGK